MVNIIMNIVLLGATGQLGQAILKQALEKGHSVKALVRNPAKLDLQHDRLEIVQADVLHDVMRSHYDVVGRQ
jgi:uncharacterized protein